MITKSKNSKLLGCMGNFQNKLIHTIAIQTLKSNFQLITLQHPIWKIRMAMHHQVKLALDSARTAQKWLLPTQDTGPAAKKSAKLLPNKKRLVKTKTNCIY